MSKKYALHFVSFFVVLSFFVQPSYGNEHEGTNKGDDEENYIINLFEDTCVSAMDSKDKLYAVMKNLEDKKIAIKQDSEKVRSMPFPPITIKNDDRVEDIWQIIKSGSNNKYAVALTQKDLCFLTGRSVVDSSEMRTKFQTVANKIAAHLKSSAIHQYADVPNNGKRDVYLISTSKSEAEIVQMTLPVQPGGTYTFAIGRINP